MTRSPKGTTRLTALYVFLVLWVSVWLVPLYLWVQHLSKSAPESLPFSRPLEVESASKMKALTQQNK